MQQNYLLLNNTNVITMEPDVPLAKSVLIYNDKIKSIALGEQQESPNNNVDVIDCKGKTVLPGFIDAHLHFFGLAENAILPDLGPEYTRSIADIQRIIRKAADETPRGKWILAKGYHVFYLTEKRHPNRWDLDKITTEHPIRLMHSTAYIHVLNSLALKMANITINTPEPPGGVIERDLDTGEPNGILYGMASYLAKYIPPLDDTEMMVASKLAGEQVIKVGITSVQDPSIANGSKRWNLLKKCIDSDILMPRVTMMIGIEPFKQGQADLLTGNSDRLRLGGVKIILSEATGEMFPSLKELKELVLQIHKKGKQAIIHAVETSHIEAATDTIEYALKEFPRTNHRHRIEHCSECPPALARRLSKLGIVAVTQPNFVYYNGDRYLKTIADDKMPYLYPFNSLIKSGITLAGSSDSPVVPANPIYGIYSAVTRRTIKGNSLFFDERITVIDALKMHTINAAYASFEETSKGSIAPGKLADLIVLDRDPITIPPDEIKELKIEMVIIGGKIVYRNGL